MLCRSGGGFGDVGHGLNDQPRCERNGETCGLGIFVPVLLSAALLAVMSMDESSSAYELVRHVLGKCGLRRRMAGYVAERSDRQNHA
jgi:hypothetical protein